VVVSVVLRTRLFLVALGLLGARNARTFDLGDDCRRLRRLTRSAEGPGLSPPDQEAPLESDALMRESALQPYPAGKGEPYAMPHGPGPATPVRRRILIVDAHPLLRRGLAALIDGESDLVVCGQTATAEAALLAIAADGPDLVIADFSLEDSVGLALTAEIRARHPDLPVLLMSIDDPALGCEPALRAGARGYVSKRELDGSALAAIRAGLECESKGASEKQPFC